MSRTHRGTRRMGENEDEKTRQASDSDVQTTEKGEADSSESAESVSGAEAGSAADPVVDATEADTAEPGKHQFFADVPPIPEPDLRGYDESLTSPFGNIDLTEQESMQEFLGLDGDYASLPNPEVFNAYPPEVQRKIMEWTDRDVKARRDDESRRQDELMRARVDQARRKQTMPAVMVVLSLLCGAVTGIVSGNPLFALVFVIIPIVVIVAYIVTDGGTDNPSTRKRFRP